MQSKSNISKTCWRCRGSPIGVPNDIEIDTLQTKDRIVSLMSEEEKINGRYFYIHKHSGCTEKPNDIVSIHMVRIRTKVIPRKVQHQYLLAML